VIQFLFSNQWWWVDDWKKILVTAKDIDGSWTGRCSYQKVLNGRGQQLL
jgi:hypothetical protein